MPSTRAVEIVDAAAALFAERGFARVGVDDVAAAVGITGGAIYKHFTGKNDLLDQCIGAALAQTEDAVRGSVDVHAAIRALADAATTFRRNGLLLTREVRSLDGPAATKVRSRIDAVRAELAVLVEHERVALGPTDSLLVADALLALMCSTAHHNVSLSQHQTVALLAGMARQVLLVQLPPAIDEPAAVPAGHARPAAFVDRRDMLIDAAIDLFGRRGYWAVTMEDLGAAVDIAGPSIYQHFSGKAELLVAVFTRGNEGLRLGLSRALSEGRDARDALRLLVASYVDFVLGHPGINRLLINEVLYLPELERSSIRGMQQRYVAEWVNLVRATNPNVDEPTARFMTHGVLSVVNNRGPADPRARQRCHDVLVAICQDLLLNQHPA